MKCCIFVFIFYTHFCFWARFIRFLLRLLELVLVDLDLLESAELLDRPCAGIHCKFLDDRLGLWFFFLHVF